MRIIWKASGADPALLSRSTYTDQLKYFCVGGLIFSTAIFGFLSGAYAFYAIFRIDIREEQTQLELIYIILSSLFGIIWGWFIYNFNRFIYISTSKGDGTEAITFRELLNAIPKFFLTITLSAFISIPLAVALTDPQIKTVSPNGLVKQNTTQLKIENFSTNLKHVYRQELPFALTINVFFAVVSITPFLLRLMLVKGPYEHMEENVEKLSKAEMGIEVIYSYYDDKRGNKISKVINHPVEFKIEQHKKLLDAQRRINEKVIASYLKNKEI